MGRFSQLSRSRRNRCKCSIEIIDSHPSRQSYIHRTKQERRELQERQRAAKAAKAATNSVNSKPQSGNQPAAASGAPSRRAGRVSDAASKLPSASVAKVVEKMKAGQTSLADQSARNQARGLLIFSHFGLPKPVSTAKGDIHPVIARTALQFSSFKITGANARCIATLTAFKTVRNVHRHL